MSDPENLPTIRGWLESWLGFQLPSIPMPKTLKNIDKAISTVVLATASNAKARIDGSTNKIKAASQLTVEDMFRTAEERRKFENRAAATRAAIDDLRDRPPQADAEHEIEEDWLNTFGRLAEEKSSEELQRLFGRILAGEIRKPGTYSLRTLGFIANLSRSDAESISKVLSFVVANRLLPFVERKYPELSVESRIRLEELGIVLGGPSKITGMSLKIEVAAGREHFLSATGFGIRIANKSSEKLSFEIGGQPISTIAQELLTIANPSQTDASYLALIAEVVADSIGVEKKNPLVSNRCSIDLFKVVEMFPDDTFHYETVREVVQFTKVVG